MSFQTLSDEDLNRSIVSITLEKYKRILEQRKSDGELIIYQILINDKELLLACIDLEKAQQYKENVLRNREGVNKVDIIPVKLLL